VTASRARAKLAAENTPVSDASMKETWPRALVAAEAAVFSIDLTRDVVHVSPAHLLGDLASATYAELLERIHVEDRARVDAALRAAYASEAGTMFRDEFRTVPRAWLSLQAKCEQDESGKRIVGLIQSHDERRRVDDARLRAIHELSLSARSAEVFVSMIAHDLKNPIGVLMGTAHAATEALPAPRLRNTLERVRGNTERLSRMLQHLREYARDRPGSFVLERTNVDLGTVVAGALAAIEREPQPEIEVAGDAHGFWDDARLAHALGALLDEAMARSGDGQRVSVNVDGTAPDVVTAVIAFSAPLPRDVVENAFRPFGGHDAAQGLGLFAARQAIVAHGGDVTIDSSPGRGSRFKVSLPRKLEERAGAQTTAWDDLVAVEGGPPMVTGITASLFGARPLYERAPASYWKIFERYANIFDDALNRRIYRGESPTLSEETRAIAEALGSLGAGANEVAELHARALKQRLRDASANKGQALIAEGRLLAFEVMGHLVTWYRRRAIIHVTEEQAPGGGNQ
jgi:signal transduction histidine kinase